MLETIEGIGAHWQNMSWVLELLLAAIGLFILFNNNLRRNALFGLMPTVIVVVYDKAKKLLLLGELADVEGMWIPMQGQIDDKVKATARQVLADEIGLINRFKLHSDKYLGWSVLRGKEKSRLNSKVSDPDEFRLLRWWGRSYVVIFARTTTEIALEQINGGLEYRQLEFVTVDEARMRLRRGHRPSKVGIYMKLLVQLERELKKETGKLTATKEATNA